MKIAIQKNGKLTLPTIDYLDKKGIVPISMEGLIWNCTNNEYQIIPLRDDDIPKFVKNGYADIGIVGNNVILEKSYQFNKTNELGFGKCRLCIAIPNQSKIKKESDLNGKTIATSYPKILSKYLREKNITANIEYFSGSIEIAPILGVSDAICDIVATGKTLESNDLKVLVTIMEIETVEVSNG